MSDPQNLVPLKLVPGLVPGSPCVDTIRNWIAPGVRGRVLPAYMRGGRIFVDPADVAAFITRPVTQEAAHAS
jgi:hypothetical protein